MSYPVPRPAFKTTLSQKLEAGDTEAFLDLTEDGQGNDLDGFTFGFVIDKGKSTQEYITGTFDAGAGKLTSLIRDLDYIDGISSNSSGVDHAVKASIEITTFPSLSLAMRMLNGDLELGGVPKNPSSRVISNARHLIDKEYADALAISGLGDFVVTDNGGITVNVAAGTLSTFDGTIEYAGDAAFALTDNATNYLELTQLGTLVKNTTGWTVGYVPLAKVITLSGDITSISLKRGILTVPVDDREITDDYTYGATIAVGDVLYLDTATAKWKLASGAASSTATGILGIALDAGVDTDTGKRVQTSGTVTGLSGLTAGYVYVSDTPGAKSATAGTYKKVVGYAPNTTTLILIPTTPISQIEGVSSDVTTTKFNTLMSLNPQFGGDGSDGALAISSGTTTIDLGNANIVVKNYTSVSITGTGKLAFSNPASTGTLVIIKSQGAVVLTSSTLPCIELTGIGAAGGTGGQRNTGGGTAVAATAGTTAFNILDAVTHGGGAGGQNAGSTPGAALSYPEFYTTNANRLARRTINIVPGSGGGGGEYDDSSTGGQDASGGAGAGSVYAAGGAGVEASAGGNAGGTSAGGAGGASVDALQNNSIGGNGGRGGGALLIQCGGALNFTGTIYAKGSPGSDRVALSASGGGGGAGGMVVILYNSLTANSGTIDTSGGAGGAGGSALAGAGGSGGASGSGVVAKNNYFY